MLLMLESVSLVSSLVPGLTPSGRDAALFITFMFIQGKGTPQPAGGGGGGMGTVH